MVDFYHFHNDYFQATQTALETVAINSAIGPYRFEAGKFEMDEENNEPFSEKDKEFISKFVQPVDDGYVEAVVHQANEGLLDSILINDIRRISSLITSSIYSIEKSVKAYKQLAEKINKTLVESEKQLKKLYDKDDIDVMVEFGAYSRFFHIGNKTIDSDTAFIEGLFVHRAGSEWCAIQSPLVLKDISKIITDVFPNIDKRMPMMSQAMMQDIMDKIRNIFNSHYQKDSLIALGTSGYSVSSIRIPKQAMYLKDIECFVKGALFDGNVILYNHPKEKYLNTMKYGCTILRDEDISRSEVKYFEIRKAKSLKAIVAHGVQISSNILTTIDVLSKYVRDYLEPLREAIKHVSQNKALVSGDDATLLANYAQLARLMNDATIHPLLYTVWIDTRLCRVIAGMAEAYFVKNPRDRTIFAKDITAQSPQ